MSPDNNPDSQAASRLHTMPFADLLLLVLKQFQRLLAAQLAGQGVQLSEADLRELANHIAARQPPNATAEQVRSALLALAQESEQTLAAWGLTFITALTTPIDALPGWESTADFLHIANEKSNAELRIAGAGALLAALGDLRYGDSLHYLAQNPELDDVNAAIAGRVLAWLNQPDEEA